MTDQENIAQVILQTAQIRGVLKSTCPSEIARELFPKDWRNHMGEIRDAAIALHNSGKVLLTQKGRVIDPEDVKGPIRIKIKVDPVRNHICQ